MPPGTFGTSARGRGSCQSRNQCGGGGANCYYPIGAPNLLDRSQQLPGKVGKSCHYLKYRLESVNDGTCSGGATMGKLKLATLCCGGLCLLGIAILALLRHNGVSHNAGNPVAKNDKLTVDERRLNVCNGRISLVVGHSVHLTDDIHYTDRGRAARIKELKAKCRGENGPPVYF